MEEQIKALIEKYEKRYATLRRLAEQYTLIDSYKDGQMMQLAKSISDLKQLLTK